MITEIRKPGAGILESTVRAAFCRQEKVEQEGRRRATEGRGQASWLRTRILWHPYTQESTPVCAHVLMCTRGPPYTQAGRNKEIQGVRHKFVSTLFQGRHSCFSPSCLP